MKKRFDDEFTGKPSSPGNRYRIEFESPESFYQTVRIYSAEQLESFEFPEHSGGYCLYSFEKPAHFLGSSGEKYWKLLSTKHRSKLILRLKLETCLLEQQSIIIEKISQSTDIDEIELGGFLAQLSVDKAFKLGVILKEACINQILLCDQNDQCPYDIMSAFFEGLAGSTALASVNLSGTVFNNSDRMNIITKFLASLPYIKIIELQDCQINSERLNVLVECLKVKNQLKVLDLLRNVDIEEGVIFQSAKMIPSLRFLGSNNVPESRYSSAHRSSTSKGVNEQSLFFYHDMPRMHPEEYDFAKILYPSTYQHQTVKNVVGDLPVKEDKDNNQESWCNIL